MKHLYYLMAAGALLCSCGGNGTTAQAAAQGDNVETTVEANYGFLERLGIKVTPALIIGDELKPDFGDREGVALDGPACRALLDGLLSSDEEEGIGVGLSIVGVKPLPGGFTLVVFHYDYGDSSSATMAVYDSTGKRTDFLAVGPNKEVVLGEYEEEENAAYYIIEDIELEFTGADEFKLEREMTRERAQTYEDMQSPDQAKKTKIWEYEKTYKFRVDGKGHIVAVGAPIYKPEGEVDQAFLNDDEILDLHYLAAADEGRVAKLDAMLMKKYGTHDGDVIRRVFMVGWDYYHSNPAQILNWMASHRSESDRITDMMENLVGDGLVAKDALIDAIDALPDADARNYLHTLTAQWGPTDAVG